MRSFLLRVFGLTVLVHVPFVLAGGHLLTGPMGGALPAHATSVVVALALVYAMRGRMRLAFNDRPISTLRRLFEKAYFVLLAGAIFSAPALLLSLPALLVIPSLGLGGLAIRVYALGLILGVYAVFIRPRFARVRTLEIPIAGLPEVFDGYRIAQLSDVHVGSILPAEHVRPWVEQTNRLGVDLVALTGDYVTSGTSFHVEAGRVLGELRARDGVFAVLGNHDNFGGCEPLSSTLRASGVRLLQNEHERVRRGDHEIVIAGVDDIWTKRADVGRTFQGIAASDTVVVLAHDPRLFQDIARRGAALTLAGHTHWGQVALPGLADRANYIRWIYRYASGMQRIDSSLMYVHPGLGTTAAPIRFGVAPEITVFVLRCAEAAQAA